MKTPVEIASEVMDRSYGAGSEWATPNEHGEEGFTRAQAESDIGLDDILTLITQAIESDRAQAVVPGGPDEIAAAMLIRQPGARWTLSAGKHTVYNVGREHADILRLALVAGIHAGINAAWCSWEPESIPTSPPLPDGLMGLTTFTGDDGTTVVQVDTELSAGRVRVNLNDAPIWDGDPETDDAPGSFMKRSGSGLIAQRHHLDTEIRAFAFPRLEMTTITDDGETFDALRCPECDSLVQADSLVAVSPAEDHAQAESTESDTVFERCEIVFEPGRPDMEETLYYLHNDHPVSLPEGWTERWM